jgi:hypothetical protein
MHLIILKVKRPDGATERTRITLHSQENLAPFVAYLIKTYPLLNLKIKTFENSEDFGNMLKRLRYYEYDEEERCRAIRLYTDSTNNA